MDIILKILPFFTIIITGVICFVRQEGKIKMQEKELEIFKKEFSVNIADLKSTNEKFEKILDKLNDFVIELKTWKELSK